MTTGGQISEKALASCPPRSLASNFFNLANAYAMAANASRNTGQQTGNADMAAPAIMCETFAVELLLKFFLAIDHPTAMTADALKKVGVKLKCHKYSELFDQISAPTKNKIAAAYAEISGKEAGVAGFREALIIQGDEPFVYWRYVYETAGISHFDLLAFHQVVDSLGKAAEAERRLVSNR
jgi:hypothetical protein